ncbi:MAG: TrbC/VirB2 family protein [Patescibacteria group bacterium]
MSQSKNHKIFIALLVGFFLFAPMFLFAADGGGNTPPPKKNLTGITNPLKDIDSVSDLLFAAVDIVTQLGFYIAVIFIIYSGFLFVKARGNKEELEKAKQAFLWTVIGTAILLGARLLAEVIEGTVDQLEDGSRAQTVEITTQHV